MSFTKKIIRILANLYHNFIENGIKHGDSLSKIKLARLTNSFSVICFLYISFMCIISIVNQDLCLIIFSLIIIVLFAANFYLLSKTRNISMSADIILMLLSLTFSFLAVHGGNNGTGPLWSLIFPAIAVIAIAVFLLVLWHPWSRIATPFKPIDKPSVAVLPFEDFSPQKDQEHLCQGIVDSVISALSNIKDLRVPARGSPSLYKKEGRDYKQIGELLKVNFVLDGILNEASANYLDEGEDVRELTIDGNIEPTTRRRFVREPLHLPCGYVPISNLTIISGPCCRSLDLSR